MPRWACSDVPSSAWMSRCLPTASTETTVAPPSGPSWTAAPTSGWSRREASSRVWPSGTQHDPPWRLKESVGDQQPLRVGAGDRLAVDALDRQPLDAPVVDERGQRLDRRLEQVAIDLNQAA